jgi:hypothetical protein
MLYRPPKNELRKKSGIYAEPSSKKNDIGYKLMRGTAASHMWCRLQRFMLRRNCGQVCQFESMVL